MNEIKITAFLGGYLSKQADDGFSDYEKDSMETYDASGKKHTSTYYDVPPHKAERNWDFARQLRSSNKEYSPEDSALLEEFYNTPYGQSIPEAGLEEHKEKVKRLLALIRDHGAQ